MNIITIPYDFGFVKFKAGTVSHSSLKQELCQAIKRYTIDKYYRNQNPLNL